MIHGSWAFRLPPIEGELLSSCLARNALAHGVSPQRFLELFWPGEATWNRDFDRDPAALARPGKAGVGWIKEIAGCLGIPADELRQASLQGWRHLLGGERPSPRGDTPMLLSVGVYHRTRLRHGLQYCPQCLGEGTPYYRRAWRLAFAVACCEHGIVLLDACPRCDAPVVPHRAMACLTDCHACGASLVGAGGGGDVPARVARLQQGLVALLSPGSRDGTVSSWAARDTFDGVRALLAVSAARSVQRELRATLGLAAIAFPHAPRLRFEQSRIGVRIACLDTVAAWLANWPVSFRSAAAAAALTQGSFRRVRLNGKIAAEVTKLPVGVPRRRPVYVPILMTSVLRRLRRKDPGAYRMARAAIVLRRIGRTA